MQMGDLAQIYPNLDIYDEKYYSEQIAHQSRLVSIKVCTNFITGYKIGNSVGIPYLYILSKAFSPEKGPLG